MLDDFFRALERNEFQLYIQFFVDADSFRIVGGEALSRWYYPRQGLLSPSRYIPLLEETGQIEALDFHVLEKACAFLEELGGRQVQDFFLSCNFARKTFSAPDFVQRCIQVVQRFSFPRKLLILEVTESQQMNRSEMEQIRQNIREIREYGMRVIFDDFGVGFSTFHDLQNCPVDGLKLDEIKTKTMRGFLAGIGAGKSVVITPEVDEIVVKSARNIPGVVTTTAKVLSVYDIVNANQLVIDKAALAIIEEVFA